MQSNSMILLAVVCGFFIILAAMIGLVVYNGVRDKNKKEQIAKTLGFSAVSNPNSMLERFSYLYKRPQNLLSMPNIFQRSSFEYQIYFFDLHENENRRHSSEMQFHSMEDSAFAFVSPSWNFPHMAVIPHFGGDGKFAQVANQLAEKFMSQFSQVIKFPHIPGLDQKYMFGFFDGDLSDSQLTDSFLRLLASEPEFKMQFGKDTFVASLTGMRTQSPTEEQIRELYNFATKMANALRENK